ncbi:hypothetical protein SUGI_1072210 [Cryptomeria japonica]|nr:hypothetical protein SUGI_1072210 [Cryptomeria japonica]
MYSSYKGKSFHFSGVDETLDILAVALELLFEEGIQACINYLQAAPWTPQQFFKIESLYSIPQVIASADLNARLRISETSFTEELNPLKDKLGKMFSAVWRNETSTIPPRTMQLTMEQHLSGFFQGNAFPGVLEVCKDVIINQFESKIDGIKNNRNSSLKRISDCENLL